MNHLRSDNHRSPLFPSRPSRTAARLLTVLAAFAAPSLSPPAHADPASECPPGAAREPRSDGADQLRTVLAQLRRQGTGTRPGADPLKVWRGAIGFFLPFPGGNGRACATCHDPR